MADQRIPLEWFSGLQGFSYFPGFLTFLFFFMFAATFSGTLPALIFSWYF
jgi:hypothetical protein